MVSIIGSDKQQKKVDVTLDIQNIYDIINGVNVLVANKEEEMNSIGSGSIDSIDREQYERYKTLLSEMQKIKGLFF